MKILHTSDWHLGKRLYKLDRTQEHQNFLTWLKATLIEKKIDVLLIAGDIFDTPSPPHQSLEIFYNFLHEVSVETQTDTYLIAGNHDSGILLEAPSRILKGHRVKIWGQLSQNPSEHWIRIQKNNEELDLCGIPFFRSYELLPQGEGDAMAALNLYLQKEDSIPQVLMLHHLAGIFEAAGSEQVISLSGVESIPAAAFENFSYVALGHIHKPQKIGPRAHYSGSPIPLRFSETISKSVVLIDTKEDFKTELLPIPVSRPFFSLKVNEKNWKEKIQSLTSDLDLRAMVEIQISLDAPKVGLIDEIKSMLDAKNMELLSFLPFYNGEVKTDKSNERLFELSPVDLFKEFYAMKFPEAPEIPDDLKEDFSKLLEKVKDATPSS
jgi:DNA repair protein SbcD/Mre11